MRRPCRASGRARRVRLAVKPSPFCPQQPPLEGDFSGSRVPFPGSGEPGLQKCLDGNEVQDWPGGRRNRYLLRLWICPPNGPPMPPAYAERYGAVTVGDRGGIVVPGARLQAPLEPI